MPNKYGFSYDNISTVKILNWEKIKKNTWLNRALSKDEDIYCHLCGCNSDNKYDDEDEFWIGFYEYDGHIEFSFSAYSGMCKYEFSNFYDPEEIDNEFDLYVQKNALKFLNMLIEESAISEPERK